MKPWFDRPWSKKVTAFPRRLSGGYEATIEAWKTSPELKGKIDLKYISVEIYGSLANEDTYECGLVTRIFKISKVTKK